MLLDIEKVDADSKNDSGRSPLSWAAENGQEAVVKMLLDIEKVDVDSKDNSGRSPLSWALERFRAASQISEGECLARSRMDCLPRPELPPVTRMTLPFRGGMSVVGLKVDVGGKK